MIEKLLEDVRNILEEVDLDALTAADAYTIQTLMKMIDSGVIVKIIKGAKDERSN